MLFGFQLLYVVVILSYCLGFYYYQFGFDGYFRGRETYEKRVARAFGGENCDFQMAVKSTIYCLGGWGKLL